MFYMNFFLSVSRNMESVCLSDGRLISWSEDWCVNRICRLQQLMLTSPSPFSLVHLWTFNKLHKAQKVIFVLMMSSRLISVQNPALLTSSCRPMREEKHERVWLMTTDWETNRRNIDGSTETQTSFHSFIQATLYRETTCWSWFRLMRMKALEVPL